MYFCISKTGKSTVTTASIENACRHLSICRETRTGSSNRHVAIFSAASGEGERAFVCALVIMPRTEEGGTVACNSTSVVLDSGLISVVDAAVLPSACSAGVVLCGVFRTPASIIASPQGSEDRISLLLLSATAAGNSILSALRRRSLATVGAAAAAALLAVVVVHRVHKDGLALPTAAPSFLMQPPDAHVRFLLHRLQQQQMQQHMSPDADQQAEQAEVYRAVHDILSGGELQREKRAQQLQQTYELVHDKSRGFAVAAARVPLECDSPSDIDTCAALLLSLQKELLSPLQPQSGKPPVRLVAAAQKTATAATAVSPAPPMVGVILRRPLRWELLPFCVTSHWRPYTEQQQALGKQESGRQEQCSREGAFQPRQQTAQQQQQQRRVVAEVWLSRGEGRAREYLILRLSAAAPAVRAVEDTPPSNAGGSASDSLYLEVIAVTVADGVTSARPLLNGHVLLSIAKLLRSNLREIQRRRRMLLQPTALSRGSRPVASSGSSSTSRHAAFVGAAALARPVQTYRQPGCPPR
ncbi:uncharacterized protein LOC113147029 [Cyclospora cayetanensis]|uniref:Uncharacterized protein LOC113147029 n=1 Tax=Cyclospora cayetanensis TaxID=88456 RepID=A0A6P6RX20_9EIME|nr:uncharacterized protein LOC113147029 [Cyclospora cayetanensis]